MTTNTPLERLNEFVQIAYGGVVADFAKALRWERTSVYKYLRGNRGLTKGFLLDVEERAGGSRRWIQEGEGPMFADNEKGRELQAALLKAKAPLPKELRLKPERKKREQTVYLSPASAGKPMSVSEEIDFRVDFNELLAPDEERALIVTVTGDSMIDAGMHDGDMVIGDRQMQPEPGDVVIALYNGEVTIKRYDNIQGVIMLLPQNHKYKPIVISKYSDFEILAVVVFVVHTTANRNRRR